MAVGSAVQFLFSFAEDLEVDPHVHKNSPTLAIPCPSFFKDSMFSCWLVGGFQVQGYDKQLIQRL